MFAVSNQAAVTTSAALTTTFTGLSVANPAGSGKNLVMVRFNCAQFAAGAAAGVGYMTGTGASAGSLITRNRNGAGVSSISVASAAEIPKRLWSKRVAPPMKAPRFVYDLPAASPDPSYHGLQSIRPSGISPMASPRPSRNLRLE
jgi:hypothetical protein